MEFEDKKKRYFVLAGLALIFIVVVFVIISFLNKETEIREIKQPQQQEVEEQKNVNDYINVIYTGSEFVPPVVISSEQKINFKNITSENIELVLNQKDSDSSQNISISSNGENMQNFLPGEYTITVADSEDQINIRIKN